MFEPPQLTLLPNDKSLQYSWTASTPAADSYDLYWKEGSGLNAATVKTGTKITGAVSGGTITGLTNGIAYSVLVSGNKTTYPGMDSMVKTGTPFLDLGPKTQWARAINTSQGTLEFTGTKTDTSGNVYVTGFIQSSDNVNLGNGVSVQGDFNYSSYNPLLIKYNSDGTAQWAKSVKASNYNTLTGPTGGARFYAVTVDTAGNVYAAGYQGESDASATYTNSYDWGDGQITTGAKTTNVVLVKYSPSGTTLWARTLSPSSVLSIYHGSQYNAVAIDSSGNVYAAGYQTGTGTYNYGKDGSNNDVTAQGPFSADGGNMVIVKYNSDGVPQWAKTITSTSPAMSYFSSLAIDSSGLYLSGVQNSTSTYATGISLTGDGSVLVKYNFDGAAQWVKGLSGTSYSAVAVDASSVYVTGSLYSTSQYNFGNGVILNGKTANYDQLLLVKYSAAGVAQWAKSIEAGNYSNVFNGLTVDSSGNIIAVGQFSGYQNTINFGNGVTTPTSAYELGNMMMVGYDSAGTAQWVRTTMTANGRSRGKVVTTGPSNSVYTISVQEGENSFGYGNGVTAQGAAHPGINAINAALIKYQYQ
jgi:hypothetical protein